MLTRLPIPHEHRRQFLAPSRSSLEHFPAKATSLGVAKMRQINRIEHEP